MAGPLTRVADPGARGRTGAASPWPSNWLSRQPPSFTGAFLADAGHRQVEAGGIVVPAHDVDCGVIGVVAGRVDIRLRSRGGAERLLSVQHAEFWCGRCDLVALTPRDLVVTAREPACLVYLPAESVRRLVLEHPAATSAFADLAVEQSRWLTAVLEAATERRAAARVARKLLAAFGPDDGRDLRLTQDELAEMTTLSRGTINRLVAELEATGAVVAGYGRLAIADRTRLRRVAGLVADATGDPAATRAAASLGDLGKKADIA